MARFSKIDMAHITEAADKGAEFYNWGWFSSRNRIESKTDKGILVTIRNADGSFSHEWLDYCIGCDAYVPLSEMATDTVCSKPHTRKEAA